MIKVLCSGARAQAGEVVVAALGRSCSVTQVTSATIHDLAASLERSGTNCWVLVDPLDSWTESIVQTLSAVPCKVLVFGALPASLAHYLGARCETLSPAVVEGAACAPAPSRHFTQSKAEVRYTSEMGGRCSAVPVRPFVRYDFTDEWNNLGYGAITADGSIWSLAQLVTMPASNGIAEVRLEGATVSTYAALWDFARSSVLWFNRSVGPVDSQEWSLVEHFIANYRGGELPCWPVVREVPYGYDAAVTMRLDCDEDVESARALWQTYREMGVPFSLALHATVLADPVHHVLPKEVLAHGGAILSHTATHAPNWGGSYEAAYREGADSAASILAAVDHAVRYAVSPFHQTPGYARAGLADAGYAGCIGGIIRNDPDFLVARAGQVPGTGQGFITHSQQCMLHGDCVLDGPDPLAIFKQAFEQARVGGAFFGYLDHPFSPRYQYGWQSEAQRIEYHQAFVAYMRQTAGVLFCNETEAMDFLSHRAAIQITSQDKRFMVSASAKKVPWNVALEYRGESFEVVRSGLRL